jgi:D-aminopeptidase
MFPEGMLDIAFRAAEEAVEEAVLDSMFCAGPMKGTDGKTYHSLREFL